MSTEPHPGITCRVCCGPAAAVIRLGWLGLVLCERHLDALRRALEKAVETDTDTERS